MHPDVEKLISIAKESGELTGKQREIIFRKARQLGEDVDEVEMILESIRPKKIIEESTMASGERMKCPNCGAIISNTSFVCPECGYTLQREIQASIEARNTIDKLSNDLKNLASLSKQDSWLDRLDIHAEEKRKANIINAFTMPTTKEGLCQFLEFSYSSYVGTPDSEEILKKSWEGKTLHAYNMLSRIGENDPDIKDLLAKYSSLISKESKKISNTAKGLIVGAIILVFLGIIIHFGVKSDNSAIDQIEVCIQNHDYQGAKAAAQKYSGDTNKLLDDISVQEVSYLISLGNIEHAKVVAAGIEDDQKRNNVLKAVSDAEIDNGNTQLLQPFVDDNPVSDASQEDQIHEDNTINSEENIQSFTEEVVPDNMADLTTTTGSDNETSTSRTMPEQYNETVTEGSFSVTAPNWVQVGERFNITFSSKDKVSDFEFTNPDGLQLVWGPQKATKSSSVDGRTVTVTSYTFVLSAKSPGLYSLSAKAKSHDYDVRFPKITIEAVK